MGKIDIVYLWCDGNDPEFIARKNSLLGIKDYPTVDSDAVGNKRFYDNDELKYSLRSLEMYASWINHVFIVTDRQVPKWLDTKYEKVTVIDHSEILPQEIIPCFSPLTLEYKLHYIPGLADRFLYSNDDMFFGGITTEKDFYDGDRPIVRLEKINKNDLEKDMSFTDEYSFANTVKNSIDVIYSEYNKYMYYTLHHSIDSYTKEILYNIENKYKSELTNTVSNRFRSNKDVHRLLIALDMVCSNKGILKEVKINRWDKIKSHFTRISVDSYCGEDDNDKYQKEILRFHPKLFCINSGDDCSIERKKRTKAFMEKLFPVKSKFEL